MPARLPTSSSTLDPVAPSSRSMKSRTMNTTKLYGSVMHTAWLNCTNLQRQSWSGTCCRVSSLFKRLDQTFAQALTQCS